MTKTKPTPLEKILWDALSDLLPQAENLLLHSDCGYDDRRAREGVQKTAAHALKKYEQIRKEV